MREKKKKKKREYILDFLRLASLTTLKSVVAVIPCFYLLHSSFTTKCISFTNYINIAARYVTPCSRTAPPPPEAPHGRDTPICPHAYKGIARSSQHAHIPPPRYVLHPCRPHAYKKVTFCPHCYGHVPLTACP